MDFMEKMAITKLRKHLDQRKMKDYYNMIRVISGPVRFKILIMLSRSPKGLSVTDIARTLNGSLSRISHQMRILKRSKLVAAQRDSRSMIYSLENPRIYEYLEVPRV